MAASTDYLKLAQSLPPLLMRFFQRHPPPSLLPSIPTIPQDNSEPAPIPLTRTSPQKAYRNLFNFWKHPRSGRWVEPRYSLRRQAVLMKIAQKHGVEELMPPSKKSSAAKARRAEQGLRVKGTGVGQKVKGHIWERTLSTRMETRRQAMMDMPRLIQKWKQLGHGRGWKKYPK